MAESSSEQYKVPEGVDVSLPALQTRLVELQPSLRSLMSKALKLFDDVYDQAPHPSQIKEFPVYAVGTMNMCPVEGVPMGRELTVVLGAGKWVRVFKSTESSPQSYPRERLWLWRPEGANHRNVNVMRTHAPRRKDYPYDVETIDYDERGTCVGFVNGASYFGQEPFIAEADAALDDAREVAQDHDLVYES